MSRIITIFSLPPPCVTGTEPDISKPVHRLHRDEPGFVAHAPLLRIGAHVRSELVYLAELKIDNRFLLSSTVMRAARMLHINSTRTEDTLNRVFTDVAQGRFAEVKLPEIAPPPPIDKLVIPLA
jgi:hypothetical protein